MRMLNVPSMFHDKHSTFNDETLSISNAFAWCISKYRYIIEPAKYVHWDEIHAGSVQD